MTAPVVVSRGSSQQGSNVTSHSVTIPSHSAGDLLIVVFATDGDPTLSTSSPGWSRLAHVVGGSDGRLGIFAKVATGSDALTVTTSDNEQSSHLSWVITGHGVTDVIADISVNTASGDTSSNITMPSI